MKPLAENKSLIVGVPFLQLGTSRLRASGQWQRLQQQKRAQYARCQARDRWNPVPDVDTRIHWSSPDEGWIGSSSSEDPSSSRGPSASSVLNDLLSTFNSPLDSHYTFLGVRPDADVEGIKAAYRKLSKLYHPDTTSLPPKEAATKFLRLQKAYDILSSVEERKIYDWALAQQISSQEGGGFVWPFEAEETLQGPGFQTKVVSSNQKYKEELVEFSGQMLAGLFFDGFAFLFSFLVIIYVAFFKHH